MDTLSKLVKALVEWDCDAQTKPGVTVSFIPERKVYYVSCVRYTGEYARGKQVMFSHEHEDLETAVALCAESFLRGLGYGGAVDELAKTLGVKK